MPENNFWSITMFLFSLNAIFVALNVLTFPGTNIPFFIGFQVPTAPNSSGQSLIGQITSPFCSVITSFGIGNCTTNGAVAALTGTLAIGYIFGNWVFAAGVVSLFYTVFIGFPSFFLTVFGNSAFVQAIYYIMIGLFSFYYALEMLKEISGRYSSST